MPDVPGVLNFPTTLDTLISLIETLNNASAALSAGINAGALLIPVTQPSEFPNSGVITILDVVPNPTVIEIVNYTSKSGSDLVVPAANGRGQQGTAAAAFSAGAIVEQRPTHRHVGVLRDAIIQIEQKIGYSSVFRPLDPAGTNQPGANLDITGGAGTGNAEPGIFGVRYPLRLASGSTLQALSTDRFPTSTGLYTNTSLGTAVSNTTTETSLFTGVTASAGSTRVLEPGVTKAGAIYRIRAEVTFFTTGSPTIQYRVKFGSVVVSDSTAFTSPTGAAGQAFIDVYLFVYSIGAAGIIRAQMRGDISPGLTGVQTLTHFRGNNQTAVDFTVSETIDLTAQWGAAAAGNSTQITGVCIERIR